MNSSTHRATVALFALLTLPLACSSGGDDDDSSSSSSSSSESFSFCRGSSGYKCKTAKGKSACLEGDCADCSPDPSCKNGDGDGDDDF